LRVREVVEEAAKAFDKGIRAVLLFGLPETKDAEEFTILRTFTLKSSAPQGIGARIGEKTR